MRGIESNERPLVEYLFKAAGLDVSPDQLRVAPMNDGHMGSLAIGTPGAGRKLGSQAAACEFDDSDGTLVSACLNLDSDGELFELDVWRVDFQPLRVWPSLEQIRQPASAV
jgi:hypothetical protein